MSITDYLEQEVVYLERKLNNARRFLEFVKSNPESENFVEIAKKYFTEK